MKSISLSQGKGFFLPLLEEALLAGLKERLARRMPESLHSQWFSRLEILSWDEDGRALQLGVPNRFFKERIEASYLELLEEAAADFAGGPTRVELAISPNLFSAFRKAREKDLAEADKMEEKAESAWGGSVVPETGPGAGRRHHSSLLTGSELNPAFTFDNFVTSASNRLSHAVALQAVERPGEYARILLCGQHGIGKTHLLQAVCRAYGLRRPDDPILYVTCERFVANFTEAHLSRRLKEFRQLYRRLRLLAVDDIQALGVGNKQASQAELLHIIDDFAAHGGQMLFAASLPPDRLEGFDAKLKDRLGSGFVDRLALPDEGVRRELIARKMRERGLELPAAAVRTLAGELSGNVRQLEGTVNRLAAMISIEGREPGLACLRAALEISPAAARKSSLTCQDVLAAVAEECGVTTEALAGRGRSLPVKRARQMAVVLCRRLLGGSYAEISQALGRRSHATLISIFKNAPGGLFSSGLEGRPVERVLFRLGLNLKPEEIMERQRDIFASPEGG